MQTIKEPPKLKRSRKRTWRTGCLATILVGLSLCLLAAVWSVWSNRSLPQAASKPQQLAPLDKARLEEALYLKASLGDELWPGFAEEPIPVILHEDQVSFLFAFQGDPPAVWKMVPSDDFLGQSYYSRAESDPQNFAIQVGDTWVAAIATKTLTDLFLIEVYRDLLPTVFEPVFPYRLLIQPSETQIGAVIHESFHVHQARFAPQRLEAAEMAHKLGEAYWQADLGMRQSWKDEVDLLSKAVSAKTDESARPSARQFLEARQQRRQQAGLSAELVDYERWLEWEEGLAKYAELKILDLAFSSANYQPIAGMSDDPDFKAYRRFSQRWSQENIQLKLQAGQEGESRFYQTGLAMAYLLDRLSAGWKEKAFQDGVFLEDLLQEATK